MNSGVQMLCGEAAVGTGAVPRQHLGQPGGLSGIGGEVFKGDAGAARQEVGSAGSQRPAVRLAAVVTGMPLTAWVAAS